jgi:GT2 family glycosyltransferase
MNNPFISIIIVNFNGKEWLEKCISSIYSGSYVNFEVIFVDNGSDDESTKFVKNNFPKTIVIENKKNLGFAG